jgi:hypothetical protein
VNDEQIDDVLKTAAPAPNALNPEMLRQIAESMKPTLGPLRPLPPNWVMSWGLVVICAAVAVAGAALKGFYGIEKMDALERALIFSVLLALAWAAASGLVQEMIPGSRRIVSSGTLLLIVTAGMAGLFALLFRDYQTTHFFSAGIACLVTGLLFALLAAVPAWLVLRRGFAVNPVSAGMAAGTLSCFAGLGMLELHCPNFQAAHVLVWHVAVIPCSAAIAMLAVWIWRRR